MLKAVANINSNMIYLSDIQIQKPLVITKESAVYILEICILIKVIDCKYNYSFYQSIQ